MSKPGSPEPPALQLVFNGLSCEHLRNRDLDRKGGKSRKEKADGAASDPFVRLRLVVPKTLLSKERELARAQTAHVANNANPSWPNERLVLPLPQKGGVKVDKKTGQLVVTASIVFEVFDFDESASPQSLGRLDAKRMAEYLKTPVSLDASGRSAPVAVPRALLDGKASEVNSKMSAAAFSWHLEPLSADEARKAAAAAPASAAAPAVELAPAVALAPPLAGSNGAGPSAAGAAAAQAGVVGAPASGSAAADARAGPGPVSVTDSSAPAGAQPPLETPRTRASRRAARVDATAEGGSTGDWAAAEAPPAAQPPAQASPPPSAPPAQRAATPDVSTAQASDAAATRIQSTYRGSAERRRAGVAAAEAVQPQQAPAGAEQQQTPQVQQGRDADAAATQIQSTYRGSAARRRAAEAGDAPQHQPQQSPAPQEQQAGAQGQPQTPHAQGPRDADSAATRIQSTYRGSAERRRAGGAAADAVQPQQAQAPQTPAARQAPSADAAATQIQASYRGSAERRRAAVADESVSMQPAAGRAPSPPAPAAAAAPAAPADEAWTAEQRAAAIRIQSQVRAAHSREQVAAMRLGRSGAFSRAYDEADAADAAEEAEEAAWAEQERQEAAAVRIQTGFRAKQAREQVAHRRLASSMLASGVGVDDSYVESEAGSELGGSGGVADRQLAAATTIQAHRRGANARAQVAQAQLASRYGSQFAPRDYDSMSDCSDRTHSLAGTPLGTPRRSAAGAPQPRSARPTVGGGGGGGAYERAVDGLRREAAEDSRSRAAIDRQKRRAGGGGAAGVPSGGAAGEGSDVLQPSWVAEPEEAAARRIQKHARGKAARASLVLRPTDGPTAGRPSLEGGLTSETADEAAARRQEARRQAAAGTLQRAERARAAQRVAAREEAANARKRAEAAARVQAAKRGQAARRQTAPALQARRAAQRRAEEAQRRADAASAIARAHKAKARARQAAAARAAQKAEEERARAAAEAEAARRAAVLQASHRLRREAAARYIVRATRRWLGARRVRCATRIQNSYRGRRARSESLALRALFAAAADGELPRGISEMAHAPFVALVDAQVDAAEAAKRRASTCEDFDAAKRAKAHVEKVDALLDRLDGLEGALADAVRAQDYKRALGTKQRIDAVRLDVCVEIATYRGRAVRQARPPSRGDRPAPRSAQPPPTPVAGAPGAPALERGAGTAATAPPTPPDAQREGAQPMPTPTPQPAEAALARPLDAQSDGALATLFMGSAGPAGGLAALVHDAARGRAAEAEVDAAQAAQAEAAAAAVGAGAAGGGGARGGGAEGVLAGAPHGGLALSDLPQPGAPPRRGGPDAETLRLVRAVFGEAPALYLASAKPQLRRAALEQATAELGPAKAKGGAAVQRARGVSLLRAGTAMLECALHGADAELNAAARALLGALLRATAAAPDSHNVRLLPTLLVPPLLATIARGTPVPSAPAQPDPAATRARGEALKTLLALCEAERVGSARVAAAVFDAHAAAREARAGSAAAGGDGGGGGGAWEADAAAPLGAPGTGDGGGAAAPPSDAAMATAALSALRELLLRFGAHRSVADARRPPALAIVRFVAKVHAAAAADGRRASADGGGANGDGAGAAHGVQAAAVQCALAARELDAAAVEGLLRSIPAPALLHALSLAAQLSAPQPQHGRGGDRAAPVAGLGGAADKAGVDGARAAAAATSRLRELKAAEASLAKTLLTLRTAARREEARAAAAAKADALLTGGGGGGGDGAAPAVGAGVAGAAHLKSAALERARAELRTARAKLEQLSARQRSLEAQKRKVRPADLKTLARARELEASHYLRTDAELKSALGERRALTAGGGAGAGLGAGGGAGGGAGEGERAALAAKLEALARARADAVAARADAQARLLAASAEVKGLEAQARAAAGAGLGVGPGPRAPPRGAWHEGSELRGADGGPSGAEARALAARLAALRDRAALRETQRRFELDEGVARTERLRARVASKAQRLAELRAQKARYAQLLSAERAAAEAGGARTPAHERQPQRRAGGAGGGDGSAPAEWSGSDADPSDLPTESERRASAGAAQPSARTAARAARAHADATSKPAPSLAVQRAPRAPAVGGSGVGAAAAASNSTAAARAAASAAAAAAAREAANAAGPQGDSLLFKIHSFLLGPARGAEAAAAAAAAGRGGGAKALCPGRRVVFAIQTELAPGSGIVRSEPLALPADGSELPVALSLTIDTRPKSAGLATLTQALSDAEAYKDIEPEVTFIVYDDVLDDPEELCTHPLDLAKLRADMARANVDAAPESNPSQKVGSFNVTVQATAAMHRARQALAPPPTRRR